MDNIEERIASSTGLVHPVTIQAGLSCLSLDAQEWLTPTSHVGGLSASTKEKINDPTSEDGQSEALARACARIGKYLGQG